MNSRYYASSVLSRLCPVVLGAPRRNCPRFLPRRSDAPGRGVMLPTPGGWRTAWAVVQVVPCATSEAVT